jgi:hypothetical protein
VEASLKGVKEHELVGGTLAGWKQVSKNVSKIPSETICIFMTPNASK